jgi:UDP-N-acetylglucosamine--N-acetylmuramyl-(pentapeptide) pyrophosphoryl-undecaprenol N-acetylglucosamine transferase
MELAYLSADIVISRAGAGTISELCIAAKPVVLVPSPNVAEDHQTRNAMALVEKEAAIMVRDADIREKLLPTISALLQDSGKMTSLSANIQKLALPGATAHIVDEALKLVSP